MKHNRVRNDWRTSIGVVERGHMKNVERETNEPYIDPKESIKLADKVKLEIKQQEEKETQEIKYQKNKTIEFNKFVKENPNALNPNTQHSRKSQNKHFRNTPEYKQALENGEHKSYFDDTKITREELNDYVLNNIKNIEWSIDLKQGVFKGFLEFNEDIAYNVDVKTGVITSTNRIKIHFSKKGFHSVPTRKVKKDES